jgi:hypothetical protein
MFPYRLTTCKNNKEVVQDLDLKGLYKQTVRKNGRRFQDNLISAKFWMYFALSRNLDVAWLP